MKYIWGLLFALLLCVNAQASVPWVYSYYNDGDKVPDSIDLVIIDSDGDQTHITWGTDGGSADYGVIADTFLRAGQYRYILSWTEPKFYQAYWYVIDNSGAFVDIGSDEGYNIEGVIDTANDGVNMARVSNDATAANNLEAMLDGTGGVDLSVRQLITDTITSKKVRIKTVASNDTALVLNATAGTVGQAISIYGDARGIDIYGGTYGIYLNSGQDGIYVNAINHGMEIAGLVGDIYGNIEDSIDVSSANFENVFRNIDTTNIDTSQIGTWLSTGVSATISDANMGSIADSVWQRDTAVATAGSYGVLLKDTSVFQGSAAGLSASEIMDSASNRGFVHYDSTAAILKLRGLHVRGTTAADTAIIATGKTSGHGAYLGGDLSGATGTGYGLYARGGAGAGYGAAVSADTGHGLGLISNADTKAGLYMEGGLYGFEALSHMAAGHGGYIHSDSGDGLQLTAGSQASKHAFEALGGAGANSDAIAIRGVSATGVGISIWSAYSHGLELMGSTTSGTGSGLYTDNGAGTGYGFEIHDGLQGDTLQMPIEDISATITATDKAQIATAVKDTANAYPSVFKASALGTGSRSVTVYALDTSGTDVAISDAKITVKAVSGDSVYFGFSNTSGKVQFALNDGSYTMTGWKHGYIFSVDTAITVSADVDSTNVVGYDYTVGSPSTPDVCRVYGYVYGIGGAATQGASVKIAPSVTRNLIDSCNNTVLDGYFKTTETNASGYWYLDITKSKCLDNSNNKYKLEISFPWATEPVKKTITVPDSTSYQVTW